MTANSKEEFFSSLEAELKRLGVENFDEIKTDFEEHFAESAEMGISEEETAQRLGDVKEIARNYLNLESMRLNSIIARDVENGKKVSLTKTGHSVPADLSLMNGKDIQNTDCVREYTPEHISEEIYPSREASEKTNSSNNGATTLPNDYFTTNSNNNANTNSNTNPNSNSTNNSTTNSTTNSAASDSVADAFSNAGKAVAEAAKVAGAAIAEAFNNNKNNVKDAVKNAGQSAADAVKAAGHEAKRAAHEAKRAAHKKDVPTPNDDFRENINSDRNGTIPEGACNSKSNKKGFSFESIKGKTPNVNGGKLIGAIILDLLLWSWLVPLIITAIVGIFAAGMSVLLQYGIGSVTGSIYFGYHMISRIFLCIGFCSLGGIIISVAVTLVKPLISLFKHIAVLHVKAIYDL